MSQPQSPGVVIVGAGGHGRSVLEAANAAGFHVEAFLDDGRSGESCLGVPIKSSSQLDVSQGAFGIVLAIGDNSIREDVRTTLDMQTPARFPSVIHPSASVSSLASVGHGAVVLQNATVGAGADIGSFCIVNSSSSVDHDCVLEPFSSVAPGAILGGGVRIGPRSAVSMGAVVQHGISVGPDAVVGASSFVNRDVPAESVVYGTPARLIRHRARGDRYL